MSAGGYMDAAAIGTPDGDDGLRDQVAKAVCSIAIGSERVETVMDIIREHTAKAAPERWWICTDALKDGGKKILGPFGSRDLALQVRVYVEQVNEPTTYWVDQEADTAGAAILDRMHRAHALADVSGWHVYESQDTGDVYPADSVRDRMAEIRAALDGTEATDD